MCHELALTPANASELNNITLDNGARNEIQQALAQGLEVTIHESPITINGWTGSGYEILNPEYGVGAYKISGGQNGAFLLLGLGIIGLMMFIVLSTLTVGFLGILFASVTMGLLIKQAKDFSKLWSEIASSNCSHEVKTDLMRDLLLVLVAEAIAVVTFEKMKSNSSKNKEKILTIMELISVDSLGYVLGQLSDGITEAQVKACG